MGMSTNTADEQYIREMKSVSVTDHLSDCIPYDRQEFCCIDCTHAQKAANMLDAVNAFCMGEVRCTKGQPTQTDDTACPVYTGEMLHASAPAQAQP